MDIVGDYIAFMYRKPIRQMGSHSIGIYIERKIVEQLGITTKNASDVEFDMFTDGDVIFLKRIEGNKKLLRGLPKKLNVMGNGFGFFPDRKILDCIGIPHDAMIEQSTDGESTIMLRFEDPNRELRLSAMDQLRKKIEAYSKKEMEKAAREQKGAA